MIDYSQAQRQKLIERILQGTPKETSFKGAEVFLSRYFNDVPPEDLLGRDIDSLRAMAIGHAEFAQVRPRGTPLVRIFNPTIATHGWHSTHSIVEVVTDDMPFLVDSVGMALNRRGLTLHLTIHPLVRLRRDGEGNLREFLPLDSTEDEFAESFLHMEIDCETDHDELAVIQSEVARVLSDVSAAVNDWQGMMNRLPVIKRALDNYPESVPQEDIDEVKAFLDWLCEDNFTFLGYREYDLETVDGDDVLRIVADSGLGILRQSPGSDISSAFAGLPPEVRKHARDPELLILTKGNARATVHRPGYIDYIGIKRVDKNGQVIGECRILGLYTSTAYNCDPYEIPVVRRKLKQVSESSGLQRGSHADKALHSIFETYPRDELFQITPDQLYATAIGILHLQERQRLKVFVRPDPYGRFVSCLIFVPRERYDTNLRQRIEDILSRAFHGTSIEFNASLGESLLARIHFIIRTDPGDVADVDLKALEIDLSEAARTWQERLSQALNRQYGEEQGKQLLKRYQSAFPAGYQDDFSAAISVRDVVYIEQLVDSGSVQLDLYRIPGDSPHTVRLRLYHLQDPVPLSDVLPILENMGLRVIAERPYLVDGGDAPKAWIHDFNMVHSQPSVVDPQQIADRFRTAIIGIWHGDVENDGFNRLVMAAELDWRQAMTLRALCRYLLQLRVPFSQSYIEATLVNHSDITSRLVAYFETRFDPDVIERAVTLGRLGAEIEALINDVVSLDEDRILRLYLSVIQATLRTNYYQTDSDQQNKTYLVLKLNPEAIDAAPRPRPKFEIFVYAPWVEGVHLRGGKVARGGIRWSDRREDYRTEILGLMKAQMVKNAVIVPVGAKGGFIVKQLPAEPDSLKLEVMRCYRNFIQGLLDVTDNLVEGQVHPPLRTVRYDDDDPYLVVAADKGTATFSDVANEIAERNRFWLGDAFASGGSTGYDHKVMGITARGAWESVKRHFRELGKDIQTAPFTVIGIGDMGGDVFGNGMLLSRQICLIAAFNHLHIFLDPDPDPAVSYEERARLFQLPRSSWADYDTSRISAGGGVFARSAKSIELSSEVRTALGIERARLTPNELITAILRAPVELLWNGGIGTFVKSSSESHADAGDRTNDVIRVNGRDLHCKVIGEGGNLGFTQLGRVEYARRGGRAYTDSIDNSGGVDCSDHEVNIKTLLHSVVAADEIDIGERNQLLKEMTEDVAALVISNNYRQSQAISIANFHSAARLEDQVRLMRSLERSEKLDRSLEFLPNDEQLAERNAEGTGLTSPELSILLSYVKIDIFQRLMNSDAPEDTFLSTDLERYFPAVLSERYRNHMENHPLRREIIATHITNSLVNAAGPTLVNRYCDELGYSASNLARAYAAARTIFEIPTYRRDVETLDNQVAAETQMKLLIEAGRLIERATLWLLQNRPLPLDIAATVDRYHAGTQTITQGLSEMVVAPHRQGLEAKVQELAAAGVPEELGRRAIGLGALLSALDIVDVSTELQRDLDKVAALYFMVGHHFQLYWMREQLGAMTDSRHWQRRAQDGLYWDLYRHQRVLTADILADADDDDPVTVIDRWLEKETDRNERLKRILAELRETDAPDLAMLTVGVRELQALVSALGQPGA
jgi:glutamate dehydrogenase